MSYFHKSGNVGTLHIINVSVGFRAVFHALCMDAVHDCMEFFVHFGSTPAKVHCVLRHFQAGSGYTTCVDRFTRSVHRLMFNEKIDSFRGTSHIGNFSDAKYVIFYEILSIFSI